MALLFSGIGLRAQNSSCPNADFEHGNFDNWEGEVGVCCPIITLPTGIVDGNHTIMNVADGFDPNTCDAVPVVAPGGTFSARLGNEQAGAQSEKLRYTLFVDPSTTLFIYKYAVVLQEPNHLPEEQPRFEVRVTDESGTPIDPICGEYVVIAGFASDGFESCNDVIYKNWTTVGLNLSAYMGQHITIEFMTGDCKLGGHYGYAYIDAYCSSLQINTAYCVGSSAAQLTAPIGFEYEWSNGATTQSITLPNAHQGDVYSCILTSPTGCQVTLSTTIVFDDPIADFNLDNSCYDHAIFRNTSQTFGSAFTSYQWDFGDGTQSTAQNPTHVFPSPGTYTVSFTMSNTLGCSRSVTKTITVYLPATAQISYQPFYCSYPAGPQMVTLTGTGNYTGGMFTSTPGLVLDAVTGAVTAASSLPGLYVVTYTLPASNGCQPPPVTATVKIISSPSAQIMYLNTVFCQDAAILPQQVLLTGTGAYTNGVFTAVPSGLSINPATGTIDINASNPGAYTVRYTLISQNECPNFIASATVTILRLPTPAVALSDGIICVDTSGHPLYGYTLDTGLDNTDYNFEWFLGGVAIPGATSALYVAEQPGNYSVVITNIQTGCVSPAITATVGLLTVANDFTILVEEEFQDPDLLINVTNGSGSYLYQLDANDVQAAPVFYDVSPGEHTISVTDQMNCTHISKDIFVLGYPKYFTPNGDGINDYWRIESANTMEMYISVYDRFGKLLHSMRSNGTGWDGTYKGNRLPATDYWFQVKYRLKNSGEDFKSFRAHFSLKR